MKISEVCQKTGLTKRTVRFYEEQGFIAPQSEDKNGRSFREYDDEDIRRLRAVAVLRKLEFSIEEISGMIAAPESIGELVGKRRTALSEEIISKNEMLAVLERLEDSIPVDIYALSQLAEQGLTRVPAKDTEPDFSKFEVLTNEEKQQAIERFHAAQKHSAKRHRAVRAVVAGLLLALTAFILVVGFSFIPGSVDLTLTGSYEGQSDPAVETVTVKGRLFTPLLFEPYFVGDVTFSERSDYSTHCEAYIYPTFIENDSGFFHNINANKTKGHIIEAHNDDLMLYIHCAERPNNESVSIDIGIKDGAANAWLFTHGTDSDGSLFIKEELVFRGTVEERGE